MEIFIDANDYDTTEKVDTSAMEQIDMTKEYNEPVNKEERIYFLFVSNKGILEMEKDFQEFNDAIEIEERNIIEYIKDAKKAKKAKKAKMLETLVKVSKAYINLFKLDKMIYTYYIEKKDISKMAELFKSKYTQLYSEILELSDELVELEQISEGDHLDNAKITKNNFDKSIRHIDFYTSATFVMITNNPIKFIR
jgi:succinate dehydrogenase flavin-adding protein (antitoxin of CptAB toxin-antitoxin module)